MNIVLCGSMDFKTEFGTIRDKLQTVGHTVTIPQGARITPIVPPEEVQPPSEKCDEFHCYYEAIGTADAILIVNLEKKGISGYIGGNTLIEMAFAYVLGKMILLLYEPPALAEITYADEINRMRPFYILSRGLSEKAFRDEELASLSNRRWQGTKRYKRDMLDRYNFALLYEVSDILFPVPNP